MTSKLLQSANITFRAVPFHKFNQKREISERLSFKTPKIPYYFIQRELWQDRKLEHIVLGSLIHLSHGEKSLNFI